MLSVLITSLCFPLGLGNEIHDTDWPNIFILHKKTLYALVIF